MPRIFELTTRVSSVSRGDGRSATAAAAYRACCAIDCEREGRLHDYRRKQGLEVAEIVLPSEAPAWARDRAKLWNGVELRERNKDRRAQQPDKANAKTARDFLFSFPAELSAAGRLNVARTIARHLADVHGLAVDFAIHQPGREGDERNFHCHMLTSTRRMTAKGLGAKAREWDDLKTGAKLAKELRAAIAQAANAELAAEGKAGAVHVEHRTFKERGSGQTAQKHQGPGRTHAKRKQQGTERREWFASLQREQAERHGIELDGLKKRQEGARAAREAELSRRARDAEQATRRELAAARAADQRPAGLRRVILTMFGQSRQVSAAWDARDAQRIEAARLKLAAVRAEVANERQAYAAGDTRERAALIDRHRSENAQLRQSLTHRESLDRSAEVVARREQGQQHDRQREGSRRGRTREIGPSMG